MISLDHRFSDMVSVVIPNYNKAKFLPDTIKSVVEGNKENIEVIIVDDHSTDHSWDLICELSEKFDCIRRSMNPRNGGSSARNHGLSMATGEFVVFLDSDDQLAQGCLENRIKMIKAEPDRDAWVFPMSLFREKRGDTAKTLDWKPTEHDMLKRFLSHQIPWSIMQPIWRRSFITRIGGFDERFPRLQDVELHTRAVLGGARIRCFPGAEADCFYRMSTGRISFSATDFQERFISGASLFYSTFYPRVPENLKKYLAGTLLETLSILIFQYRSEKFSRHEFLVFKEDILNSCIYTRQKRLLEIYTRIQEKSKFHIKGLKWLMRRLLFW